jgi:hypothetical protein
MKLIQQAISSILLFTVIILITNSCKKEPLPSRPSCEIRSILPSTVTTGSLIETIATYEDLEGDIDSVLLVYKWYDGIQVKRRDTFKAAGSFYNITQGVQKARIKINIEYATNTQQSNLKLPAVTKDTTAAFGIILIDKDQQRSNYSESEKIRLRKN